MAGNTATSGPDLGESGDGASTTLLGVNLFSDTSGNNGLAPAAALIVAADPKLAPLGDYGGPTQTMPPLPSSSPAVDAAITLAGSPTTDERGLPRIFGGFPDIGAAELQYFIVTTLADSGGGSLRDTIASTSPGNSITFDPSLSGQTITLGGAQLFIDKDLTIDASALPGGITIDANGNSRVFLIDIGKTVVLNSLTITGGNAADFGGGIYSNKATLSLTSCTLSGNSAGNWGGGIYSYGQNGSDAEPHGLHPLRQFRY